MNLVLGGGSKGGRWPEPVKGERGRVGTALANGGLGVMLGAKRKWAGELDPGSNSIPGLD